MDKEYIQKMQVILEKFVDPNTGVACRQNRDSIVRRLGQNPEKLPVSSILLELKAFGLLDSDFHVVLDQRMFFITSKGYFYIKHGGVRKFYEELELNEKLETKILEQTNQSFKLNRYQFWVMDIMLKLTPPLDILTPLSRLSSVQLMT